MEANPVKQQTKNIEKVEEHKNTYLTHKDVYANEIICELLGKLEDRAETYLVNKFLKHVDGEYDENAICDEGYLCARDDFRRLSAITSAVMTNPGTSVVTELLYGPCHVIGPIDNYVIASKTGRSIYGRFMSVLKNMYRVVKEEMEKKRSSKVKIVSIGAGPGTDMVRLISGFEPAERKKLTITLLDRDARALKDGFIFARHRGVDRYMNFKKMDLSAMFNPENGSAFRSNDFKQNSEKYDIALLIGIVCPMGEKFASATIKGATHFIKTNGKLIVSAAHRRMQAHDPFTDFIMKELGAWKLIYKDEAVMKRMYDKAGLDTLEIFYDEPLHFHMMPVGLKRNE